MQFVFWIIGGFALLYTASVVEAFGDLGASPGERLPFYFTALAMLGGALFCFFKGWRGAMAAMGAAKAQKSDWSQSLTPSQSEAIPATRIDDDRASSDFDVDAAFERYIKNRNVEPQTKGESPPAQPRRRTSFGRKPG